MGVLQDFERRLEGAVEGAFARMFRSGLQPVELAKALQRYARDTQHVHHDGVVVPNVYRFGISQKDHDRLTGLGVDLRGELAAVVVGTAAERGWILRGPATVQVEVDPGVRFGRYELTGRVEAVAATPAPAPQRAAAPASNRPRTPAEQAAARAEQWPADRTAIIGGVTAASGVSGPRLRITEGDTTSEVPLEGRTVAGRGPACELLLADSTVSREHAAFVRRDDGWWVVDLGSTNGTRVNGTAAAEHPLRSGDTVELGEVALEFIEG